MWSVENPYFLPYQRRWLADRSRMKIWEKSRRIGATYAQSYEDVRDCVENPATNVWFSSADESAAREYIALCERWTALFNVAAKRLDTTCVADEKSVRVSSIDFASGARINALSSNPRALRSKGGKIVLDEFAFHSDADALWAAARPCVLWGHPLRILSSHNGTRCRFNSFVERVKKGGLDWNLHSTTLRDAVSEGLADRISAKELSDAEREAWIKNERAAVGDESAWLQEYCCVPDGGRDAFLSYETIDAALCGDILGPDAGGDLFAGVDVGRKNDLTVLWVVERVGRVCVTREVQELDRAPFGVQREALFAALSRPNMRRVCMDATGLGMQLAEEARSVFGQGRVEGVTFTAPVKEHLAWGLRRALEDGRFLAPALPAVREDLHSVRRLNTVAGHVRFDADSGPDGHADRFWAATLAQHAVTLAHPPAAIVSALRRDSARLLANW